MDLKDKVILITGGAQGIGRFLAEEFLAQGAFVVVTDINVQKLNSIQWKQKNVLCQGMDVAKDKDWLRVLNEIKQKVGAIDIVINNAGVIEPSYVNVLSMEHVHKQIDINLKGVIFGTSLPFPFLSKNPHIINFSSLAGVAPISGLSVYSASKYGVRGFSLAAAIDLKALGIQLSVICPDLVDTNMLYHQLNFEEANLTFSGSRVLTFENMAEAVFVRALGNKEVEICVPKYRGAIAKIANLLPSLSMRLTSFFVKIGRAKRLAYLKKTEAENAPELFTSHNSFNKK